MIGTVPAFGHARYLRGPMEDLVQVGFKAVAAQYLRPLLAAEKAAQVEVGNLGGGLLEAFAQLDLGAHLVGQLSRDMKGLGFAFDQDRKEELRVQLLARGATAGRFATLAGAHHKGAGEHLAQSAQAADQAAAESKFGVRGHH